jgi:hypothetical protein
MSATPPAADETVAPLASALVRAGRARSGRRTAIADRSASGSMTPLMDRRAFIGTLSGGLLAAAAPPVGRILRLGLLYGPKSTFDPELNSDDRALVEGLRANGYELGRHYSLEVRSARRFAGPGGATTSGGLNAPPIARHYGSQPHLGTADVSIAT